MHNILAWLKARLEVIVPLLAVPTFFAMVELTQGEVKAWQTVLVYGLALVYIGVVVWSPMGLPAKAVLPVDREITRKVILTVTAVVLAGAASLVILSLAAADSGEGKTRLPYFVLSLLLIIFLGSGGVIAERGLTIDMGLILRYRGLLAAVLVHGLGDWVVIMLLGNSG